VKNKILLCSLLVVLLAACGSGPAPSPTPAGPTATPSITPLPSLTPVATPAPGVLLVDAGQKMGPVSPLVYGSNFGPEQGSVPLGVAQQAVDAKLTYMRFPDGNWGDQNDIEQYQIDMFVAMCKKLGCAPAISVRLQGGTPQQAADLVRYTNVTKGYKVQWWSIGNEPDLYSNYNMADYNQQWRQFAQAIRAVDPSIKLVGPDFSRDYPVAFAFNPKVKIGKDWFEEFLKANGDMLDVVSIHRYPYPLNDVSSPPSINDLRANSREWDQIIPALRALIRKDIGRDLPVAVTEVNSSYAHNVGGEATLDSFYNAIWWGDVLGRLIRQGVDIVAQFELLGDYGLFQSQSIHPIYYVYMMYQNFGSERVYASSDDPDVSIYAATRPDGALTIMLINLGPDPVTKPLQVNGFTASKPAQTWLFDPKAKAEQQPDAALGQTVTLPGQSMTLIVLN
jgi:hypothetical protein